MSPKDALASAPVYCHQFNKKPYIKIMWVMVYLKLFLFYFCSRYHLYSLCDAMFQASQTQIFLWTSSSISSTIFLQIEILLRKRCSLKSQLKKKIGIVGLIRSFPWKVVYEPSFLNVPLLCGIQIYQVLTGLSSMIFIHHSCLKGWIKLS